MGLAAGIEISTTVLGGLLVGWLLDRWLKQTAPGLTLLFGMLGLGAGFYRLYRTFSKSNDDNSSDNGKNNDES